MSLTTTELNALADKVATDGPWLSLHTALPDGTGSNESTAARVAASWPSASGGAITVSNKAFTGGASSGACTHVGLWSASSGGTFRGAYALTGDQSFNAAGAYTLTSLTVTVSG